MIVTRKVYKSGHSQVIAIPPLMLELIELDSNLRIVEIGLVRIVEIGLVRHKREQLIVIRAPVKKKARLRMSPRKLTGRKTRR